MAKFAALVIAMVTLGLAACSGTQASIPSQAAASTPVSSLPVNVAFQTTSVVPTAVPQEVIDAADAEYLLLTNVYQRVTPSVVNIEVVAQQGGLTSSATASGFVYDMDGHIITNAHVAKDASDIRVTFNDGYVAQAQSVGVDTYSDLAVVKVDVKPERLHPVTVGDSDGLHVGERAIAIGNPFGLASSMTVGIISGLGRQLRSAELIDNTAAPGFQNPSIIQVDTEINPGNSGGPLLNSHGEVIGVNTAIRTDTGVFQGVGFAVPASTIKRVVPELIAKGHVDYAWIGISAMPSDDGYGVAGLVDALKLPVNAGVLISAVSSNSPAAKAGLQGGTHTVQVRGRDVCAGGDIIVAVNGSYINDMDGLTAYLVVNTKPGDTVKLLVVRGSETFEVPVALESRPTDNGSIERACGQ
jgi:S1-C subfamily serine protease